MPDGSNNELLDIRMSYKYNYIVKFDLDPTLVEIHLRKLVDINDHNNHNNKVYWTDKQNYDIIEYLSSGFLKEHCDKQIKKTYYGTLLNFFYQY
jgi:hypothetical protein